MDNLSRITSYFPTGTITAYVIIENLVVNDTSSCAQPQRDLTIALMVIFAFLHALCCFTDSYTTSQSQRIIIFMIPFYGPLSNSLPTEYERDRVYEMYYLKGRDYVHALLSTSTFVLVMIFTNPVSMCLFPSGDNDGTTRFESTVLRAVPIIVAAIMALLMLCLGNPRQMLGMPLGSQGGSGENFVVNQPQVMGTNPVFSKNAQEGYEESYAGDEETGSDTASFAPAPLKPYPMPQAPQYPPPSVRPSNLSTPRMTPLPVDPYSRDSKPRSPRDVSMQMGGFHPPE